MNMKTAYPGNAPASPQDANIFFIHNAILLDANGAQVEKSLCVEAGKIAAIAPRSELTQKFPNAHYELDATGLTVTPGFNDSHCHTAMTFLRDLAHSATNMIETLFFPMESNLRPDWVEVLAYPYILHGLRSGTTCFWEHYYFAESIGNALTKFGVRGMLGETIADLGGAFPSNKIWPEWRKKVEHWQFPDTIQPVIAPHAADTVSESLFKELAHYAKTHNLPLHFHLAQTPHEVEKVKRAHGVSPVVFAERCGALSENTLAVHLVSATRDDLKIIKSSGASIGYCPKSQILYEQLSPVATFMELEIPLCLGTDAAASNDSGDILSEMQFAAFTLHDRKAKWQESAESEALRMTTINPARIRAGVPSGEIRVGHAADLVFFANPLDIRPVTKPLTNLIFSHSARHVRHTLVDGKWVLWQQEPVHVRLDELEREYAATIAQIRKIAGLPLPIV